MKTEQKDTADPQTAEEVRAFSKKYSEAFNKHDASAQGALFTEDAVFVTPEGMVLGRQAIEKQYADIFQQLHPTNHIRTVDQVNAIGSDVWNVGEWSCILQSPDGPSPIKGYFASVNVREGDAWKIRMLAYNLTPAPAETTTTSNQ
jgi:uncharacterized protein (TIGR02246 family)